MKPSSSYDSAEKLLGHILMACDEIIDYTKDISQADFENNSMVIRAVERCFEIIGEASNKLQSLDKSLNSKIPYSKMRGFRNRVAHDYMGVNYALLHKYAKEDVPELRIQILALLGK